MPKLSGNEYLTLASTFHGLHAISSQVSFSALNLLRSRPRHRKNC